jgi:hypothetical protein
MHLDAQTREKLFVLASLYATFAGAFLLVVTVNYGI